MVIVNGISGGNDAGLETREGVRTIPVTRRLLDARCRIPALGLGFGA